MKEFFNIILISLIFLCSSCSFIESSDRISNDEFLFLQKKSIEEKRELEKSISEKDIQINNLANNLNQAIENEEECQAIIKNFNNLVKNLFYVYGFNGSQEVFGTGFSIIYENTPYFITAGHIVDGKCGYHERLGFKQNLTRNWYYPKLLYYSNKNGNDLAIFEGRNIYAGFEIDTRDSAGFIMGNLELGENIIKSSHESIVLGESGSPVINKQGRVTGFRITAWENTDIDKVVEVLDKM